MPSIEIYHAKVDPADVGRLLEIRAAAVAEFQEQVPELVRAELVRLEDGSWLDVLVWSEPVAEHRLEQAAQCAPAAAEMHALIGEVLGHQRGEILCRTEAAWASAR